MATFGEMLAELRKDRGMTQRELADVIHVSVSTISNYEQDIHFPDMEKLLDIADFFHVTTDYLLGRCSSNLSTDVFSEILVGEKTVGDIIQDLRKLPSDRKNAIVLILCDMLFHITINRYGEKDKR